MRYMWGLIVRVRVWVCTVVLERAACAVDMLSSSDVKTTFLDTPAEVAEVTNVACLRRVIRGGWP